MAGSLTPPAGSPVSPLTKWLILTLAAIGFAFDIYELLMLPLVGPDALRSMGIAPGSAEFRSWVALLFYLPAVLGGIFGLMGGYLTDWLGRRRVLTWSILLYAFSAFFSGFTTSPEMLLVLRCTTFVGVCVEFVAAVAWLAELFPEPDTREKALGYTQAFSSLGGLMVAIAYGLCNQYGANFYPIAMPAFLTGWLGEISTAQQHAGWRYTLMSGLIPAIPLILIRPFLPESPAWAEKKRSGTLKRPSIVELFTTPQLRKTTIVTTIMFACSYGAAFGAIQQIRQIVPGLEAVQEETRGLPPPQRAKHISSVAAEYTMLQEAGGLTGRFLLALLIVRIASRQTLIRLFQIPGLIITPLVFYFFLTMDNTPFFVIDLEGIYLHKMPFTPLTIGIFFVGLFTVAQFSFWGNYLPHVYPLHLRGTGESFAANIGGRMIGTMFAAVSVGLSTLMPRDTYPEQLAMAAALVGLFVYTVGVICSFFLPEPKSEALPD